MAKDEEYRRLIQSATWRRLRHAVLSARPLCADCLDKGLAVPASEVHHTVPVESGCGPAEKRRLAYDPHNLRPLCHACHVAAHEALGRSGKEATRRKNAAQLESVKKRFFQ